LDLQNLRRNDNAKRRKYGYMWALFCAILWGLWYIPGTVIWVLNPFDEMFAQIAALKGDSVSLVMTAVLITAFNALTVLLALTVWIAVLGKLGETKRTIKQFRPCSKWFFLASIFGGPIAILGSFMAMGLIGGAFAAVAALLFPIVGAFLASIWYGEKISKRAALGILVILTGGISLYGGSLLTEFQSGSIPYLGLLGGLMTALGWGIEGAIAGKGLDVAEPDAGLYIRFLSETLLWWIIIIPVLAIMGFPMFTFAAQIFEPLVILVLLFAGITFGFCYVTWYKSFPLVGVGRGQAVGTLAALVAVISIYLFFGTAPGIAIVLAAILCISGGVIMITEVTQTESIR